MEPAAHAQDRETRTINRLLAAARQAGQAAGQVAVYGIILAVLYQVFGGDLAAVPWLPAFVARLVEKVGGDLLAGLFDRVASDESLDAAAITRLFAAELEKRGLDELLSRAELRQDLAALRGQLLRDFATRDDMHRAFTTLNHLEQERMEAMQAMLTQVLTLLAEMQPPGATTLPTAPPPPEHFVGREGALARLAGALTRAERPQAITALQGSGGIGKTALAQMLASQLAGHFSGGVFWADLPAVGGDPLPSLAAWARHCGQDEGGLAADAGARAGQVRGLLAARQGEMGPLLLVLDDARPEWVDGARMLQAARPQGAALLLTTREELVARRLGATTTRLDVLEAAAAEQLLLELAPEGLTADQAAEVAQRCGYWPLALRLAGALAEMEGAGWLLPRLRDEQRRLGTLAFAEATSKEESVALTFDLSYGRLVERDAAAARAFRWLGVFAAAAMSGERLAAVLAWGDLPAEEQARRVQELARWGELDEGWAAAAAQVEATRETLRRLRRAALLQPAAAPLGPEAAEGAGTAWYALHPLLRDYAGARLAAAGEEEAAEGAHRAVHLAYAIANDAADPAAYDALERARADVLLALDRAYAAGAWAQVRRFVWAVGDPANGYLGVRGYWEELRKRLEQAVAAAEAEGNKGELAAFVHNLAVAAQATGEMDLARRRYEESLAIERELGNRAGIAITLGQLANLEDDEGNEAEAERLYREAIVMGEQIGDVAGMSIDLFNLALLLEKQARLTEALPLLQQSLAIFERLGSPYANHVRPVLERVRQKL
ncbi:MAG: tetratricopeptide repeat protein [Ardenticatenales bacterium]|nr:tetratricopeptide repeat protein [Ardenticatenales bacterium]